MKNRLRVIEICAGAGGQSLGLECAGFDHELAIELDPSAAATLKLNRPDWNVVVGDVADRTVWDPADYAPNETRPPIDLFAGGVPCPPFSIAGRQLGTEDERDLFAWAVEQVAIMRPRAVMLENVRGLSMPRFAGYRQHVLDRFNELGYHAQWRLLNSSDFGIAQLRPRFVLVAMAEDDIDYFHWPAPVGAPPTVGDELLSLMAKNGWEQVQEWAKGANTIGPTIVGGSKKHGGADLGPTRAKRSWAELGVNGKGIADLAPSPDDTFEVGPKLTLEMVAKLQGWNEDKYAWNFHGKKTSVYRQIGNAFPPPVAHAIGNSIFSALNHLAVRRGEKIEKTVADPIYKALKSKDNFMTIDQIMKISGMVFHPHEIDSKIATLGRDFTIEKKHTNRGWSYRLGEFKAFIGQDSHVRHSYFEQNISKVS